MPEDQEPLALPAPTCEHDDELEKARAEVIRAAGYSVVLTPPIFILLAVVSAFNGHVLVIDDRILVACLSLLGTIIAFGFRRHRN